ncbi:Bug family tripartite tricarboxylate transporter substrate binding protein [Polynucleobacter antarcticus]|nr:tripartite tricarboxylate transporter substrate binding protein [Polynucleobacter antarcticus]
MKNRSIQRRCAMFIFALLGMSSVMKIANAQSYPNKPITLVAPYSAGGDSDFSGRNLAAVATKYINQPLIVQNIVGASGTIGSQKVRTSPPDGYTLLIARGGSQAISPALDSKTPYKWNDFTFIAILDLNPVACVVKSDSKYKTMKELLAAIRAEPGKLNYASAGSGTTQHLAVEVALNASNLPSSAALMIPYKSGGEATTALLSNQVDFICNNLPTLAGQIKGGTVRALMVSTPERLKDFPDVPTGRDLGLLQFEEVMGWSGLYGPPGLPSEVVNKWVEVLKKVAQDPAWARGNETAGAIAAIRSPAETEVFARQQVELYEKLGNTLGLRK